MYLYLSSNLITGLDGTSFKSLQVLLVVDVERNPITYINPETFIYTPKLLEFWCDNCNLSEIHEDTFIYTPNIRMIGLRSNNITHNNFEYF